jgi:hypothetical protein
MKTNHDVHPTFLYIGNAKSGSSWIFEVLYEHPDVFVPVAKDLRFFEDEFYNAAKFQRYLGQFNRGRGKVAIGELSHNYILSSNCAKRIHHHLPNVKLLVCLREPGDLATADYKASRLFQRKAELGFDQYKKHILIPKRLLLYYENLLPYFELFPAENVNILFLERLRQDPSRFTSELYSFLGIDPTYIPKVLHTRVNVARASRFGNRSTQILNHIAQAMRHLGLENMVGYLKRHHLVNALIFSNVSEKQDIPLDEVNHLRQECAQAFPQLETLIGCKLPDEWYEALQGVGA